MKIKVLSFGFGNGMVDFADYVFDVRCLPNPFWVESLRPKRGTDKEVADYIFSFSESRAFFGQALALVQTAAALFAEKEKEELVVAFGCTGGHHRSVACAERMGALLQSQYEVEVVHRDIRKGDPPIG